MQFMATPEHAMLNLALPSGSKALNKEIDWRDFPISRFLVIACFVFQYIAIEKPSACRKLEETLEPRF